MEGDLLKWNQQINDWKKVYGVIQDKQLKFYSSKDEVVESKSVKPLEEVPLGGCDFCRRENDDEFSINTPPPQAKSLTIKCSHQTVDSWIQQIQKAALSGMVDGDMATKLESILNNAEQLKSEAAESKKDELHQELGTTSVGKKSKKEKKKWRKPLEILGGSKKLPPPREIGSGGVKVGEPQSFYSTRRHTFADVRATMREGTKFISMKSFLDACADYNVIFDRIGNTVLMPVKSEMTLTIDIIKKNQSSCFGDDLLAEAEKEIRENRHMPIESTTQSILWAVRTLRTMDTFTTKIMNKKDPSTYKNINSSFQAAYDSILVGHYSWVATKVFKAAIKFVSQYPALVKVLVEPDSSAHLSFDEKEKLIYEQQLPFSKDLNYVTDWLVAHFKSHGLQV